MTKKWSRLVCHVAAVACMTASYPAMAQLTPAQTGPASAARAQHDIQDRELTQRSVPNVEIKQVSVQAAPAGAEKISFKLTSIQLEGITVYHQNQLAPLYAGKIGKTITLADVYGIAADLTRKYRNDGYVLTQVIVPPQHIKGGSVTLRVVEGYIDHVEVRGYDDPSAVKQIKAYADHVRSEGKALNIRDLERAMLLINDLPGVDAQGVLSPSPTETGAADLLVQMTRKPYDAQIGVDNYSSRFLGPWEVTGAAALNSVLGLNERITAQVVNAPGRGLDSKLWYGGLDYDQPIFDNGMRMEFFGSDTYTHPGYSLQQFDVIGHSVLAGARIKYPFLRSRDLTFIGRATLDMNNVDTDDNIEPHRHDRIRSMRLGGKFEYLDTWLEAAYSSLDLEVSQGLEVFGTRPDTVADASRANATPDYTKIAGEFQRLERLTSSINLLLGATGQWSDDVLYTAEEFGVGGSNYGRGYDPSEITGDSGVAGKIELQWTNPYTFHAITKYQMFGFVDGGRVWSNNQITSSEKRASLTSTGVGFRTDITPETTGGFLMAFPLTRGVQSEDGKHDTRYLFSLSHKF